jgi:hypothetical protein
MDARIAHVPARPRFRAAARDFTEGMTALRTTLRALESFETLILGRGQRTARRNAWTAVLEDRRRAWARTEAERVLEAATTRRPTAT